MADFILESGNITKATDDDQNVSVQPIADALVEGKEGHTFYVRALMGTKNSIKKLPSVILESYDIGISGDDTMTSRSTKTWTITGGPWRNVDVVLEMYDSTNTLDPDAYKYLNNSPVTNAGRPNDIITVELTEKLVPSKFIIKASKGSTSVSKTITVI